MGASSPVVAAHTLPHAPLHQRRPDAMSAEQSSDSSGRNIIDAATTGVTEPHTVQQPSVALAQEALTPLLTQLTHVTAANRPDIREPMATVAAPTAAATLADVSAPRRSKVRKKKRGREEDGRGEDGRKRDEDGSRRAEDSGGEDANAGRNCKPKN